MTNHITALLCAAAMTCALPGAAQPVVAAPTCVGDVAGALRSPAARFVVLRHEKKGPDRKAGLDRRVRKCQRNWRGSSHRDLRVLLQDDGAIDGAATRDRLDEILGPDRRLAGKIFHSRYCRSLETAVVMLRDAEELVEVEDLDLGTGDLRAALAQISGQLVSSPAPAILVTHKDRFADIGLEAPLQGGGYVLAADGACLATLVTH